jgi:hypothetical protein
MAQKNQMLVSTFWIKYQGMPGKYKTKVLGFKKKYGNNQIEKMFDFI